MMLLQIGHLFVQPVDKRLELIPLVAVEVLALVRSPRFVGHLVVDQTVAVFDYREIEVSTELDLRRDFW